MKKIFFFAVLTALLYAACTPKSGDKMSSTKPATTAPAASGKAPKIPMPTGDVRAKAPLPGEAPKIQIGKAQTFQLDNGLTVIVVENHKLPVVSYRIFVDNDPVLEKEATGYTDLMGELLGAGTKTRTKAQINEEVDFLGGSLYTNEHGISAGCLSKHSDKMLSLMSDVLLNPIFPADELEKAKRQEESSLAQDKTDANKIASQVGRVLRFTKNHPYGEVTTEETLSKINLDQIKGYYNTYFKPNISYLVVVGDVTKEKAEQQAKKYFGKWAKGEVPKADFGAPRPPEKTQVAFVHKPGAVQSVIAINYPVDLQPGAPDAIQASLMNAILGGQFISSRLNSNLREGHGWTYGAGSGLREDKIVGYFSASAAVRNSVTDSAIVEVIKEMDRLRTEKISATNLQDIKNIMTGKFSASLEEPGTVAEFALDIARHHLPADYYETYLTRLQAVTPEEIMMAAKKYLRPDKAYILVVGDKEQVSEKLKPFSADKKINFYDAVGNPVKNLSGALPAGVTGMTIVQDYLNVIGGLNKIAAIKDIQKTIVMKSRGPEFTIQTWQKGDDKVVIDMSMSGQLISKRILNGDKAIEHGTAGASRPLEGTDLADLKEQAPAVKEVAYLTPAYQLNLKGMEEVEGKNAYLIEVKRPDGKMTSEYYEVASGLKIREQSNEIGEGGVVMTVTTDMSDYKEVNGVKFPHALVLGGYFPIPMKATMTEIKVNTGLSDALFEVK